MACWWPYSSTRIAFIFRSISQSLGKPWHPIKSGNWEHRSFTLNSQTRGIKMLRLNISRTSKQNWKERKSTSHLSRPKASLNNPTAIAAFLVASSHDRSASVLMEFCRLDMLNLKASKTACYKTSDHLESSTSSQIHQVVRRHWLRYITWSMRYWRYRFSPKAQFWNCGRDCACTTDISPYKRTKILCQMLWNWR